MNQTKQARRLLKNEIVKDTEKFVPLRDRNLRNSVIKTITTNDDYIIYDGPYARFLYLGKLMIGKITRRAWAKRGETKVVTNKDIKYGQPLACSRWFERSKALCKDKWIRIAKKVYKNG